MNPVYATIYIAWAGLVAGLAPHAFTEPVQFVIDDTRTQVSLSGTAAGLTVAEQGPGSLTTSFQGVVNAELTPDSIRFVGGGRIDGVINGDWSPQALGVAGTAPADFGAQASGGGISGTAALRDLLLDLESETVLPLSQGTFNADGLLFRFPEDAPSAFDYRVQVFIFVENGRELLAGYATNRIATAGSLTTEGSTQVLQIPIDATVSFELLDPGDSQLTIKGQLRATRELGVNPGIVIGSVRFADGALIFEWSGAGDQPVRIESSTDWENWTTAANLEAGITTWSVEPTGSASFFRVVQ
jgi:hypothetical protein